MAENFVLKNAPVEVLPAGRIAVVQRSVLAGAAVAMVAVPLCVGIAAISPGIPAWAGILSGIIGGVLVGTISRSRMAITGPTAGLTAVVATQLAVLGSFEALLLAVMFAGLLQIILGCVRTGSVAAYRPRGRNGVSAAGPREYVL